MISIDLPQGWKWAKLEEIQAPGKRSIVSGPFGSNIGSRFFVDSGIPLIRGNNLTTGMERFIDEGFVYITKDKARELANCEALPGDLVFTAAGTLGQVGLIPDDAKYPMYIISNKQLRARLNLDLIDPLYAFYWLASSLMVQYIVQRNTGSTVPLINLSVLRALPIPLPPLPEQRAIAHILGSLDDMIELNRQIHRTLEEIARAVFKSWFVDFDPVHAKAAGEQPVGMDGATADLFPTAFEDSVLGPVPEGWGVEPVGSVVKAMGGGTPSTTDTSYWDGGVHYFATPKDLSALTSSVLLETERKVTDAGLSRISSGLLPVGTVLLSSRAPIGYLALAQVPVCINQGFIAMICDGPVSNYYMLNWTYFNMEMIKAKSGGTTFAEISKGNFRPIPAIVPSKETMQAFDQIVQPMYDKLVQNEQEIRTLAELRDTLLPKLMSGELRVPDVGQSLEGEI